MAKRVINRRELRVDEETEKREAAEKAAKKVKKKPATRSRSKASQEVRLKAFWGVFNQSMKRVALFEHSEREEAEQKAKDLSASSKSPHFVMPVKEPIQE